MTLAVLCRFKVFLVLTNIGHYAYCCYEFINFIITFSDMIFKNFILLLNPPGYFFSLK